MPIKKTPNFSPNVAARVLKESGLEGKVTSEQLADAAEVHDTKNAGYISGDEFKKAAADLKAAMGGAPDAGSQGVPGAPTHSPLFVRGAAIDTQPRADLSDPLVKNAQERILANVGPGERFGAIDAGDGGLRAFTLDDATFDKLQDADVRSKLAAAGGGQVFGVLSTGDEPSLTLATSTGPGGARVLASYDLLDDGAAAVLGGDKDALQAATELLGDAPMIELGGEKAGWQLGSSDWASGAGLADRLQIRDDKEAARLAARGARAKARDEAMAGPTTVDAFAARGVAGHKHTAAEKKELLALVTKEAGEDKTFPNPDDSYYGLHTFLMEGPEAAHAVAFAQANRGGPVELDLEKHSVLLTIKSFDEAQVGTFVVDRESGKVLFGDESNAVDYDYDAVEKFFPKADMDDAFDANVIGTLAGRGELLGVVAGEHEPDSMDFSDWA